MFKGARQVGARSARRCDVGDLTHALGDSVQNGSTRPAGNVDRKDAEGNEPAEQHALERQRLERRGLERHGLEQHGLGVCAASKVFAGFHHVFHAPRRSLTFDPPGTS